MVCIPYMDLIEFVAFHFLCVSLDSFSKQISSANKKM